MVSMSDEGKSYASEEAGKPCEALPGEQTLHRRRANSCERFELRKVPSLCAHALCVCVCSNVCEHRSSGADLSDF